MAILIVRDENGNIIEIPAIKGDKGDPGIQGEKGDSYVLTEADKSEIVALVIESLGGNPVFGYVDKDNNIIVSGNLAGGTYSVKYETEDGSTVDIGQLLLDGEDTGDEPENVLETVGYQSGMRIRSSTGEEQEAEGVETTGFIPIAYGDTITIENITAATGGDSSVVVYDTNKAYISGIYLTNFMAGVAANAAAINGEAVSQVLDSSKFIHTTSPISASSGIAFIRFSANEITENSIVTVQKN